MTDNDRELSSRDIEALNRNIRWHQIGKRTVPVFLVYLTMDAQRSGEFQRGTGLNFAFKAVRKLGDDYALSSDDVMSLYGILSRKAREHPKSMLRLTDLCRSACERVISYAKETERQNLTLLGTGELLQTFELFYHKLIAIMTFGFVPHILNRVLEQEIIEYLSQVLPPKGEHDKIGEYFHKLIFLREFPEITKEELQVLNLSAEIEAKPILKEIFLFEDSSKIMNKLQSEQPELMQRLEGIRRSYGWLRKSYWIGPPASVLWYIEKVRDNLRKDSRGEITRRVREEQERELEFKKTLDILSPPESFVNLIHALQALMFLHTFRIEVLFLADHLAPNLFEEISRRTGAAVDELLWYTTPEIRNALTKGATLPHSSIATRKDGYGIFMFEDRVFLITGNELGKIVRSEVASVGKTRKFEGRPAFKKGKVKGVVRIIVSRDDIPKMKQGNILVASMTNTYLMPAVTKAGAIVTDEGGVTCHAAIVARELKIPCVIGTQIATKQLRDGDLIEVDSDNGVITIV